jgi:two-component system alkaline phosphatase synthesis response regulator PhoP
MASGLEIDVGTMQAWVDGALIALTTKERELLIALARRRGGVARREELADEVWGASVVPVTRTLDVHMSSLRNKLGDSARTPLYIETLHGIGFRLLV